MDDGVAPVKASPETETRPSEVQLFGLALRSLWVLVFLATLATELIPRDPTWLPYIYYPFTIFKAALFVLLGFATPLAFWKFDSLGFGSLFAVVAAGVVEGAQLFLAGHQASYFEFAAKLILLFLGFVLALNVRYDRRLQIGPLRITLSDVHFSRKA